MSELTLGQVVRISPDKIVTRSAPLPLLHRDVPQLVVLAAGKGTRFGQAPKCAQPVCGIPVGRYSINAFRGFWPGVAVCVVGYQHEEVMAALGDDNIYILTGDPAGGTAYAALEALSFAELEEIDPILVISMGDRIVPATVFRKIHQTHTAGAREADLTFLTAIYEPPRNHGKGRVVRDADRRVLAIIEQRDIDALADPGVRQSLDDLKEGNCPLYGLRARTFRRHAERLTAGNAQRQYYITDIIESIRRAGGEIRTVTTVPTDPDYDLLCSDVTAPMDLALLEGVVRSSGSLGAGSSPGVEELAARILADRPAGQVASIASQLEELHQTAQLESIGFCADAPLAFGISGGRLRIAFMHPDMGRFYGPAWQMPIGARDATGREQIIVMVQSSDDGQISLHPTNPKFRERLDAIPADRLYMYPGGEVGDWYSYEGFGTRMAETLLLELGYFTDLEVETRRERGQPIPPQSLWVSTSMRRPFSLVGNAIASMRTVRTGNIGRKVQAVLGRDAFRGLRIVTTGDIPRGGFSSSSAVTVATKNAINALFDLGLSPDLLVHLSCQAEYGTGVRAGSLDQATEEKGRAGEGALISSNPRDNFRILGTYPVPVERYQVLFPYTVDRDREAWRWSGGVYAADPAPARQTTGEVRKMTGKAAEIAAVLVRLPLDRDFFQHLEMNLVATGRLEEEQLRWVADLLLRLPLLISQDELRREVAEARRWYIEQVAEVEKLDVGRAAEKTDATLPVLFAGWRDPVLRRGLEDGTVVEERGVPLRAMVAYLFCEVAKNFRLIHQPDDWIAWVRRSQRGDRSFEIDPERLPAVTELVSELPWEAGLSGPERLERWLEQVSAHPFDYNQGLDDSALSAATPPDLCEIGGTNFFRGLALIDLAEAMLVRAFGREAVAVRVNAAGQGDFFQVHVDLRRTRVEEVKNFIRFAFYRRFGLRPEREFIDVHTGGGAIGLRLERFDQVPELVSVLRRNVAHLAGGRLSPGETNTGRPFPT